MFETFFVIKYVPKCAHKKILNTENKPTMERSENEKTVTVQRRDTSVPAHIGSEQAGSQASRSRHRSTSLVDILATAVSNATRISQEMKDSNCDADVEPKFSKLRKELGKTWQGGP